MPRSAGAPPDENLLAGSAPRCSQRHPLFAWQRPRRRKPALLELPPGNYTAVVRGKNGDGEVGLIEVYNLP